MTAPAPELGGGVESLREQVVQAMVAKRWPNGSPMAVTHKEIGMLADAIMPLLTPNVDAAVERAARVAYEQRERARWESEAETVGWIDEDGEPVDPDGWKRWADVAETYREGFRSMIRPIVLAALGIDRPDTTEVGR